MHRMSIAIEAIEQCRKEIRNCCSGKPEKQGAAAAAAAFSAIRAQTQIEQALKDMVQATRNEEEDAA